MVPSYGDAPVVEGKGTWTADEHTKFLAAIQIYPNGPWKLVAQMVGTRTVRQTQTHAQKYREKMARHKRGLRMKVAFESPLSTPSQRNNAESIETLFFDPIPYNGESDYPSMDPEFEGCVAFLLDVLCSTAEDSEDELLKI